MTEEKRSKLTLKLKSPVEKSMALSQLEKKKTVSSGVQVTIKGRKKEPLEQDSSNVLSKNEFDARVKALQFKSDDKTPEFDVLKKIRKTREDFAGATENKEVNNEVSKEIIVGESEKKKIYVVKNDVELPPIQVAEIKRNFISSAEIDSFDVHNKIRQSLETSNREKQEKEKILEEKKKQEAAVSAANLKKKKKPYKPVQEEDSNKKPDYKKPDFKKKFTYIISGDDDERFGFYKKKKRREGLSQKEYKKIAREVEFAELITVSDLADKMSEKTGDVVKKLFSMGVVATSNQVIDSDTAEIIIGEFGHTPKRVSHSTAENILDDEGDVTSFEQLPRSPIVTIMGHVDHGKTSLLDAIRSSDVVASESGGITQHIGASRIQTKSGKFITFLDTPGHEAFTEMRSRGANATDIVVLVVAADDGVKEQTIEAISHAKAAKVPIIVAVNKIDKPGANPEIVKKELLSHDIISEDFGGDVIFVNVSAKDKLNLDKLEDAILLQAEMLDLRARYEGRASGIVIESRVDQAKGVIATLLVQHGTIDLSDLIVVGTSYGKIRKMTDEHKKHIKVATPSMPVEVLGLSYAPNSGEKFFEVAEEKHARDIISYRERKTRDAKSLKNSAKSLVDVFKESGKDKVKHLNVIIKADVHGSVEAIAGSIVKLNNKEVAIKIVHQATGGINESDVSLASVSNSIILGFNVRSSQSTKEVARLKIVEIRYYSIIYNIVDDLKLLLSGMLESLKSEECLGQAEIRQVFKISGVGKIAGGSVIDGLIKKSARVRILRDNIVIHDGILKTLKRFKDDVKEVKSGFECGFSIENYDDIKEKDVIECYEIVEQKRSL
jgi:translation initiation factor IF-2